MTVADDARALRALLEERHGEVHQSVSIGSASKKVHEFWEAMGWAPWMEKRDLVSPDPEVSEAAIEATLAGWRGNGMSTLTRASLPERVQMVTRDNAGVGFLIADETTGANDPPLLAVLCDTNQVSPEPGSYLKTVARTLIGVTADSVWIRAQPVSLLRGKRHFPVLLPDIADTKWGLHIESREGTSAFVSNSATDIFRWLREAPITKLDLDTFGTMFFLGDGYDFVRSRLTDVLELPAWRKNQRITLGKLEGIDVLLNDDLNSGSMHSDHSSEDELFYLAHGVTPSRWPLGGRPVITTPSSPPRAEELRELLEVLDPEHGTLDATTDAPSELADFLEKVGRGPLIDELWPTTGTLPGGPVKGRRIAHTKYWSAFTDEDEGRPDPVAVWNLDGSIVLAAARSTTLFASNVVRTLANQLQMSTNRVLKGMPWTSRAETVEQLADGVYVADAMVFARDADAWLTYLETLDEKVVRGATLGLRIQRAHHGHKKGRRSYRVDGSPQDSTNHARICHRRLEVYGPRGGRPGLGRHLRPDPPSQKASKEYAHRHSVSGTREGDDHPCVWAAWTAGGSG